MLILSNSTFFGDDGINWHEYVLRACGSTSMNQELLHGKILGPAVLFDHHLEVSKIPRRPCEQIIETWRCKEPFVIFVFAL